MKLSRLRDFRMVKNQRLIGIFEWLLLVWCVVGGLLIVVNFLLS